MNLDTFKIYGKVAVAAFVNAQYGNEATSPVANWVRANLHAQRPVTADSPGLFESYDAMVSAVKNYGPNITQQDLDAAIAAWNWNP